MSWGDIPGWTDGHLETMYRRAVEMAQPGDVFVEVGVAFGRSTALMAELLAAAKKDIRFHIVDNWRVDEWLERDFNDLMRRSGGFYEAFCSCLNVHAPEAWALIDTIHKCDSVAASTLFDAGSVGFVFVDGAHDQASVAADVAAWYPKIRAGGWIAGHDHTPSHPGVELAVRGRFGDTYEVHGSCWLKRAPEVVHVPGVTP